ncbi:alpha,alpha-trehalase TreF [Halarchaeum sp. P4]|uniref:alpha,alpha-trehalase TreF n=1 Tax=Halarchaeum sp. P4 TaxID=3421639 RepID=UPI003EBBBFF4
MGDDVHPAAETYPQLAGALYEAVQRAGVFADSKTFVDATPTEDPEAIREAFHEARESGDVDLVEFVRSHFDVPSDEYDPPDLPADRGLREHIDLLWDHLARDPATDLPAYDTRLELPADYVVPGGRFRELYYWDTYFTAEGLAADGRVDLVDALAENFASLIERLGHVPNGSRVYFESRSQPPLFARLLAVLERERGVDAVEPYLDALEREHAYWMDGAAERTPDDPAAKHVVRVGDTVLNRHWDARDEPRPESYREDVTAADALDPAERPDFYRDVRAAAESGWDFSSRWLADPAAFETMHTTDLVPVDLNSYLYGMERRLAGWLEATGDVETARTYDRRAAERKRAVEEYCWDEAEAFYFDYDWTTGETTDRATLAAAAPLWTGLASDEHAAAIAERLEADFLAPSGLLTTLTDSGEQWDAPNGWAPLQYVAVEGLRHYGHDDLADEVRRRFLAAVRATFEREGKLVEKYDVRDPTGEAGGGEYELQDGFGWTNGVVAAWLADD